MPIDVHCSRCGMQYEVADTKAGKKGRCPTCGGSIHVPSLGEAGTAYHKARQNKHLSHMIAWTSVSVIAALLLLIVILVLREESSTSGVVAVPSTAPVGPIVSAPIKTVPAQDSAVSTPSSPAQFPAADSSTSVAEKQAFLIRYAAERLGEYRALVAQERRLRAREILRKSRENEPVQMEEYELRNKVNEEAALLAEEGKDVSGWRLDEPLDDEERRELANLSTRLGAFSNDLRNEFMRHNLTLSTSVDIYGRRLIDISEAQAKLDALLPKPAMP